MRNALSLKEHACSCRRHFDSWLILVSDDDETSKNIINVYYFGLRGNSGMLRYNVCVFLAPIPYCILLNLCSFITTSCPILPPGTFSVIIV